MCKERLQGMTPEQATSQCVQGVAKIIPECFPGLLVAKEVHILSGLFLHPSYALGGADRCPTASQTMLLLPANHLAIHLGPI